MGQNSSISASTAPTSNSKKSQRQEDERGGDDDVKRQIDSNPNNRKLIYQLVNVKTGGGKLIEVIKSRARHQSSSSIESSLKQGSNAAATAKFGSQSSFDDRIRELVLPLLYNEGRGKLVPLSRLWEARLNCHQQETDEQVTLKQTRNCNKGSEHRWVCWKLEERGFVGETALHICFLLSTPSHMILARKLLELFPMLINDIYTCDEYFGESSLHMAIVNENVRIVKLLLDHGANVHERCLGSFFLPHDQKDSRTNAKVRRFLSIMNLVDTKNNFNSGEQRMEPENDLIDLKSNHFNSPQTNYEGFTYWGEYPLSFAASLGLDHCYRLLLAKGANPNLQDSNGNSTLHICVIADRIDMFDLCYSNGANLNLVNKLGLSPLTLAAKLRRVNMFFHILTIMRQINWIFCSVAFVDYPLRGIDSINTQTGQCDELSVLSIVVSGNSNEHLKMLDGPLSELLQVKWDTSLRNKFYSWLAMFLFLLLISSLAYVTRFNSNSTGKGSNRSNELIRRLNQISELLLVACIIYYLYILANRCNLIKSTWLRRMCSNSKDVSTTLEDSGQNVGLMKVLVQAPELTIFTLTCFLVLICVPCRLFNLSEAEKFLVAIVMFLMPLKLLFFCRASRSLGSFIVMIYKILVNDVLCFVVFLIIFISGFAQSFLIIFKTYQSKSFGQQMRQDANQTGDDKQQLTNLFESIAQGENHFLNLFDSLITMHMIALNEFSWVLDEFAATDYPNLAKVLFCVYMILVSILLINMLIAMLGKTYQDITSQPNESLRQWARALLTVERICSRVSRLKMLKKYSHDVGPEKCPCYSLTWALSANDLNEINRIKTLNRERTEASRRLSAYSRFR